MQHAGIQAFCCGFVQVFLSQPPLVERVSAVTQTDETDRRTVRLFCCSTRYLFSAGFVVVVLLALTCYHCRVVPLALLLLLLWSHEAKNKIEQQKKTSRAGDTKETLSLHFSCRRLFILFPFVYFRRFFLLFLVCIVSSFVFMLFNELDFCVSVDFLSVCICCTLALALLSTQKTHTHTFALIHAYIQIQFFKQLHNQNQSEENVQAKMPEMCWKKI